MHEEEHRLTVRAPKCGKEGCDCEELPDEYEGTVEEVVQKVSDEAYERDEFILELLTEQSLVIAHLMKTVEKLANPMLTIYPEDGGNPKLN